MNCPASKGQQHYLSRSEYEFQQRLSWLFGLPPIRPSIPLNSSLLIFDLGFIWGWSCQFALNSYYVGQALRMFANHDFYRTICTNQIQNWLKPNVENHPLSRFSLRSELAKHLLKRMLETGQLTRRDEPVRLNVTLSALADTSKRPNRFPIDRCRQAGRYLESGEIPVSLPRAARLQPPRCLLIAVPAAIADGWGLHQNP